MNLPRLEIGMWVESAVDYAILHFGPAIDSISSVISSMNSLTARFYVSLPGWLVAVILVLLCLRLANWKMALFTVVGLGLIDNLELWQPTMQTLSLMTTSVLLSLVIGIPLGILASEYRVADLTLAPVLDFLQTLHPFVYLVPVVVAFGIGEVPAVLATALYVTPVSIRLTNLGLKQVPVDVIEAGDAFGSTRLQSLVKVKLPTAAAAILAGVTQTVMLSLGFIVIAALIGAQGLGAEIVRGISRLDLATGFEAGIAVVIVAIILDRIGGGIGRRMSRSVGMKESLGGFFRFVRVGSRDGSAA